MSEQSRNKILLTYLLAYLLCDNLYKKQKTKNKKQKTKNKKQKTKNKKQKTKNKKQNIISNYSILYSIVYIARQSKYKFKYNGKNT